MPRCGPAPEIHGRPLFRVIAIASTRRTFPIAAVAEAGYLPFFLGRFGLLDFFFVGLCVFFVILVGFRVGTSALDELELDDDDDDELGSLPLWWWPPWPWSPDPES